MSSLVVIFAALLIAASSIVSAVLLSHQARVQRQIERREDYAQQNLRDDRAAAQTRLLIETNERIARRTEETGRIIEGKLDVIHGLVNSGLTAAKQSELDATERDLASLKEIVAIHRAAGNEPDEETKAAVSQAKQRVIDLQAELLERRAGDEAATMLTEVNEAREARDHWGS